MKRRRVPPAVHHRVIGFQCSSLNRNCLIHFAAKKIADANGNFPTVVVRNGSFHTDVTGRRIGTDVRPHTLTFDSHTQRIKRGKSARTVAEEGGKRRKMPSLRLAVAASGLAAVCSSSIGHPTSSGDGDVTTSAVRQSNNGRSIRFALTS